GLYVLVVYSAGRRRTTVAAALTIRGPGFAPSNHVLANVHSLWLGSVDRHSAGHAVAFESHEHAVAPAVVLAFFEAARFDLEFARKSAKILSDRQRSGPAAGGQDGGGRREWLGRGAVQHHEHRAHPGRLPDGGRPRPGGDRQIRPSFRI